MERSFVRLCLCLDKPPEWVARKRAILTTLLEQLFLPRRGEKVNQTRRQIHYYQGFNSICSVFVLLHPNPGFTIPVIVRLSESYLLDHLSSDFDETIKWLQLVEFLLKYADKALWNVFQTVGMTYHFALPWIITWFSHSLKTFSVVIRLFDFFIGRHPLTPVYLTVSLITNVHVRRRVLKAYEMTQDMPEMYGELQFAAEMISATSKDYKPLSSVSQPTPQSDSKLFPGEIPLSFLYSLGVYVGDLIKSTKDLMQEFPVQTLLSTAEASKIADDSVVWLPQFFSASLTSAPKSRRRRKRGPAINH